MKKIKFIGLLLIVAIIILSSALSEGSGETISNNDYCIFGSKTQIIDTPIVIEPWSRFIITSEDQYAEWTFYVNDEKADMPVFVKEQTTITEALVQSNAPWKLDYSPMLNVESPYLNGINDYVSDFFTLDKPTIVSVTLKFPEDLDCTYQSVGCSLGLYSVSADGTTDAEWYDDIDWISRGEALSVDLIAKPVSSAQKYFWFVSCNGLDICWDIHAK